MHSCMLYLQHDDDTLLTDSQLLVAFYPLNQRLVTTLHSTSTALHSHRRHRTALHRHLIHVYYTRTLHSRRVQLTRPQRVHALMGDGSENLSQLWSNPLVTVSNDVVVNMAGEY